MNSTRRILACSGIVFAFALAAAVVAQEDGTDRLKVPFSDPSRPGRIKVGLLNGGISVRGYDGKDVLVEARPGGDESDEDQESRREREHDRAMDGKRGRGPSPGMRRVRNTATGLTVEEDNNVMEVGVQALNREINISLQVPRNCSLELNTVNGGNLEVVGVNGEIDVNNTNGEVSVTDVTGSVVAHALNGNVVVTLNRVDPKKAMSFSSLNGDIDVTLPADVRANVRTKSDNGEIFSDFDIQWGSRSSPKVEEKRGERGGGKYRVRFDNTMSGTLNGGGPEMRFETFNGNIYIRKR